MRPVRYRAEDAGLREDALPHLGMRDALVTTLLVQLAGVALTGLLSLRLPRTIG
ncbi:hypothetical protein ACH4ZX_37440 [Streptomyces sp. NPDC020490]|uniref:hypothetical protein n=1 Tax=Streptomyces sp. NPDC020490 TaxID=3365078 RepID=UPI0037AA81D0